MTRASAILLLLLTLLLAPRPNSYGRSDWARTDGAVLLASGDDSAHRRQKDLAAPSRSFLTTLQSAVRVHRRSLAGDGRFIVHVVGSVPKIEGRVAWPYAGHHACGMFICIYFTLQNIIFVSVRAIGLTTCFVQLLQIKRRWF